MLWKQPLSILCKLSLLMSWQITEKIPPLYNQKKKSRNTCKYKLSPVYTWISSVVLKSEKWYFNIRCHWCRSHLPSFLYKYFRRLIISEWFFKERHVFLYYFWLLISNKSFYYLLDFAGILQQLAHNGALFNTFHRIMFFITLSLSIVSIHSVALISIWNLWRAICHRHERSKQIILCLFTIFTNAHL